MKKTPHERAVAEKQNFIRTVWNDDKTAVIIQTWIEGEFKVWVEYDMYNLDNLISNLVRCREELTKEFDQNPHNRYRQ